MALAELDAFSYTAHHTRLVKELNHVMVMFVIEEMSCEQVWNEGRQKQAVNNSIQANILPTVPTRSLRASHSAICNVV